MPLSQDELIQIENVLHKTLHPMERLIEKHNYTLYGANGNNGLCDTVRSSRELIQALEKWRYKLVGGIVFATSVLTLFGKWLLDNALK